MGWKSYATDCLPIQVVLLFCVEFNCSCFFMFVCSMCARSLAERTACFKTFNTLHGVSKRNFNCQSSTLGFVAFLCQRTVLWLFKPVVYFKNFNYVCQIACMFLPICHKAL